MFGYSEGTQHHTHSYRARLVTSINSLDVLMQGSVINSPVCTDMSSQLMDMAGMRRPGMRARLCRRLYGLWKAQGQTRHEADARLQPDVFLFSAHCSINH